MSRVAHLAGLITAIGVLLASACGRGSAAVGSPAAPSGGELSGRIVRVLDGTPIANASVQIGDRSATSSASGEFSLDGSVAVNEPITVFALGYLRRQVPFLDLPQEVTIDLIPDDLPFRLNFYRQWVRNARESPGSLATLRRWTRAPSFYIKTTVEETGAPVPADIVDRITAVLVNSVPELSGGRFTAGAVETGTTARVFGAGWVRVTFHNSLGGPHGLATVGGDGGTIELLLNAESSRPLSNDPNGCGYDVVRVAEHEITHTMGFRHTVNEPEDFHSTPGSGCTGAPRSDKARYHAAVAYSRPVGNADVDVDPRVSFGLSAPTANRAPVIVSCRLPR